MQTSKYKMTRRERVYAFTMLALLIASCFIEGLFR